MAGNPAGLSDVAVGLMIGFARGDTRVINALALHFVHGMGFRRIGRELGVDHTTVMDWVEGYANAGKDYCTLRGVGPEGLQMREKAA